MLPRRFGDKEHPADKARLAGSALMAPKDRRNLMWGSKFSVLLETGGR